MLTEKGPVGTPHRGVEIRSIGASNLVSRIRENLLFDLQRSQIAIDALHNQIRTNAAKRSDRGQRIEQLKERIESFKDEIRLLNQ